MLVLAAALALVAIACGDSGPRASERVLHAPEDGVAERGREAIPAYGCQTCHVIPGVKGEGHVGPPLTSFSRRAFIAGVIENNADNLMTWIIDPPAIAPDTAMPNMGVSGEDARDIAAYLATLD